MKKVRKEVRLTVNLKFRKSGKTEVPRNSSPPKTTTQAQESKNDQEEVEDKLYEAFPLDCFNQPKRKKSPVIVKEFKPKKER